MATYKLTISQSGPPGMVLNFYKDGTNTASCANGNVNINSNNGAVSFSGYTWSTVTSSYQWPGYPTGGTVANGVVTLTLSDGTTLTGTATAGNGYYYTFDNLAVVDTYRFYVDFENNGFTAWKNGTSVGSQANFAGGWPSTSGNVKTWTGTYNSHTIFGASYLNSSLVQLQFDTSAGTGTATLADGTVLEGSCSWSGEQADFTNMRIQAPAADTYGFSFYDSGDDFGRGRSRDERGYKGDNPNCHIQWLESLWDIPWL